MGGMSDLRVGVPRASVRGRGAELPAPQGQKEGLGLSLQPGGIRLTEEIAPWAVVNTEGQLTQVAVEPLGPEHFELAGF